MRPSRHPEVALPVEPAGRGGVAEGGSARRGGGIVVVAVIGIRCMSWSAYLGLAAEEVAARAGTARRLLEPERWACPAAEGQ